MKELVVSVASRRAAIVVDGRLDDLFIESQTRTTGNIYRGRVSRIEQSLSSAFVDIGSDKSAFLYITDVNPVLSGHKTSGRSPERTPSISSLLDNGQEILVQVTKPAAANKGSLVSTYITIPGRYLILAAGLEKDGVSRSISEQKERQRIESIVRRLDRPDGFGVVARSSATGHSLEDLRTDLAALLEIWDRITTAFAQRKEEGPRLLHDENDFVTKALTEYFDRDIGVLRIDDQKASQQAEQFIQGAYPNHPFKLHVGREPIFDHYGIEDEIKQLSKPDVHLPNQGTLIIEKTRGVVSIDVLGGNVRPKQGFRAAILEINLAAAREIPRQLRLRNMEGLIVIDFIGLDEEKDRRLVVQTLRDSLQQGRGSSHVLPMSPFGLVEMSYKRNSSIFVGRADQVSEAEAVRPRVFLCYRREDSRNQAGRIHDWLTDHFGEDAVFYDLNIPIGKNWRLVIEQAIRRSSLMLVLIGDQWLGEMQKRQNDDQDFVRFEIEKAIEREVPIVPLSLGQTTFPSAADLPSSISELAYQNGMQIRDEPGFRSDMKELIDALMKFGLTSTKKAARRKSAKG